MGGRARAIVIRLGRSKILTVILVVLLLAAGLYLLRWPLFGGAIRSSLEAALSDKLGIDAEIGALSGSLLTGVRCASLEGTAGDERAIVRSLSLTGVEVSFDPLRLRRGDLTALSLTAAGVAATFDLTRPGIPAEQGSGSAGAGSLPAGLPALDLAIDALVLRGAGGAARFDDGRIRLRPPEPGAAQAGRLTAGSFRLILPGGEESWTDLTASCSYGPERAALRVDARLLGGEARLRGEAGIRGETTFRADLALDGIDLARVDDLIALLAGPEYRLSLGGNLGADLAIDGSFSDPASIGVAGSCSVEQGACLDFTGVDVALQARLKNEALLVDACSVSAGRSRVLASGGRLPFRRDGPLTESGGGLFTGGTPRFMEAALAFTLDLDGADPWLPAAGVVPENWPGIESTYATARGTWSDGAFAVETLRLDSPERTLALEKGSVILGEWGVRIGVGALSGRIEGVDLALSEPFAVAVHSDRVVVEPARFSAGPCAVDLDGEIGDDGAGVLHLAVDNLDRAFLASFLPAGTLPDDLDWEGLSVEMLLDGPVRGAGEAGGIPLPRSPAGRIDIACESFEFAGTGLDDVAIAARIAPDLAGDEGDRDDPDGAAARFRIDVDEAVAGIGPGGRLAAAGHWVGTLADLLAPPLSVGGRVEADGADLALLGTFLPPLEGLKGQAGGKATFAGKPATSEGTASLRLSVESLPPSIAAGLSLRDGPPGPIAASLDLRLAGRTLAVERLRAESRLGLFEASGVLPLAGPIAVGGSIPRIDADRPISGEADLSRCDLAPFGAASGLEGRAAARLRVDGSLSEPRAQLALALEEALLPPLGPHRVDLDGSFAGGTLRVDRLAVANGAGEAVAEATLSVAMDTSPGAPFSLPGPDSEFDLDLRLPRQFLDRYADAFGFPAGGTGTLAVEGHGTLGDPVCDVKLDLEEIAVDAAAIDLVPEAAAVGAGAGLPLLALRGRLSFGAGALRVHELRLSTDDGDYLAAAGRLPVGIGWERLARGAPYESSGKMDLFVESSAFDLARLAPFLPGLRRLEGVLTLKADLGGTPAAPICDGRLALDGGSLRLESGLPSIEGLSALLEADGGGVDVVAVDGMIGGGPFHIDGRVPFNELRPDSFDLNLRGDHVLVTRGDGLRVRANCDATVTGPVDGPLVAGTLELVDTRYVKHIPLFAGRGPATVDRGFRLFSLNDPFGSALRFDLAIVSREEAPVTVANNLAEGEVTVDLTLRGTGRDPWLRGDLVFNAMLFKLPNCRFRTDTGRLSFFERNPYDPELSVTANARRQSYDIEAIVTGPVSAPEVILTSSPPLDSDALLVLVSTGSLPETVRERGLANEALQQVGTYLGRELIHELFGSETTESGESLADRFELTMGTEVGSDGTNNLILEYRMKERWYLQAERDIYGDANAGVVYRIRFR